jgi:hypothetical protein
MSGGAHEQPDAAGLTNPPGVADPLGAAKELVDGERPNPARMYDYLLGGSANFEADRRAVAAALKINPEAFVQTRSNRAFLRRAVRTLVDAGVRQFLDLGSGVPTVGHVHEIAQRADSRARVVYVDNEPVAAAYSRQYLAGVEGTTVLPVDLRDAHRVLHHPDTRGLINLDEPVGVLMFAMLHFIMDDREVTDLVAAYRDATVAGSYLAISHGSSNDPRYEQVREQYRRRSTMPFRDRTADQLRQLFAGYEVLEPGVVAVSDWRPDPGPDANRPSVDVVIGGVGRRR